MSRRDLDRSAVKGLAWTGGVRTLTQSVQWIAALLVVRLLTPEDYGLVAMAGAYFGLVRMFSEFGLGAAIVQRRDLTESQVARLGGFSILSGTILALVSLAASGLVAAFFGEPRVQNIVMVLSVTFVLTGVDVVPRSLLRRDLDFRRLAWIQASQNFSFAGLSLTLAAIGFGYWSLVLAGLGGSMVRMTMALAVRRHPVAFPREIDTIRSELWFGAHVVVTQLALYIRQFSDVLVVGRVLGTEALGAYNVAWQQANVIVERVSPIVSEVSAAVLAASQNDRAGLRRYVKMFTEGIALLAFPATFGLAVVADDFVALIFGDEWLPAIGPLRILALVAAFRSITPVLSQVLIATDQAKKNMQFAVAGSVVIPAMLYVGSRWGITGVALGWLVGHPLVMGTVLLRYALQTTELSLMGYLSALRAPAIACGGMVAAVIAVRAAMPLDWPLWLRFILEVGTGVAVYGGWMFSAYRKRFQSFLAVLRSPPSAQEPSQSEEART